MRARHGLAVSPGCPISQQPGPEPFTLYKWPEQKSRSGADWGDDQPLMREDLFRFSIKESTTLRPESHMATFTFPRFPFRNFREKRGKGLQTFSNGKTPKGQAKVNRSGNSSGLPGSLAHASRQLLMDTRFNCCFQILKKRAASRYSFLRKTRPSAPR
jgi:hypothetical protein